jgi:hypothetical protein
MGMEMCPDCYSKEKQLQAANNTPAAVDSRLNAANVITQSRNIDAAIQVRTDLFNAATTAIVDLKTAIDTNPEITNKTYALAEELTNRFQHYKAVIFEHQEIVVNAANQQKAIQTYLNTLANQLRADEREKLKLADLNYKPKEVKPVTPKGIKTTSRSGKLDKVELRKYAAELGIPEFTLQMIVVSKGITVEAAANMLRKSIAEAKSMAPTVADTAAEPTKSE